jgi:hypothetical protein
MTKLLEWGEGDSGGHVLNLEKYATTLNQLKNRGGGQGPVDRLSERAEEITETDVYFKFPTTAGVF